MMLQWNWFLFKALLALFLLSYLGQYLRLHYPQQLVLASKHKCKTVHIPQSWSSPRDCSVSSPTIRIAVCFPVGKSPWDSVVQVFEVGHQRQEREHLFHINDVIPWPSSSWMWLKVLQVHRIQLQKGVGCWCRVELCLWTSPGLCKPATPMNKSSKRLQRNVKRNKALHGKTKHCNNCFAVVEIYLSIQDT